MNFVCLFLFKCIIYVFALIYNIGFCIWLFFYTLFHPRRKYWRVERREKRPQCLNDPTWGVSGYMQLKDVRIHYVENGDRSKPLMLLIHGFPEFWYSWRYQLREFSKDYWVVAIDLRGYGESQKFPKKSAYKIHTLIEDIRQIILYLGREKATLIGHDWGGLILWNFLDFHPGMIDKYIILNCPHPRDWTVGMLKHPLQFIKSWYCFFFQMPCLPELALSINDLSNFQSVMVDTSEYQSINKTLTEEDIEAYKYTYSQPGAVTHAVNYYRANCGLLYLKDKELDSAPSGLLLFGQRDSFLMVEFVEMARRRVNNLQTYVIKDASHFVQQDQPVHVNNVMREFLEGRLESNQQIKI